MHTELLRLIVDACDDAEIPHMIAGSFASTYHSDPRMTRDIDIVIDPTTEQLDRFVSAFSEDRFYVSDAQAALRRRDMFNIIDTQTGWSADLIIRKDRAFSIRELERRESATFDGIATFVASVEDTILAKLDWSKDSGSDRQFEDVVAMVAARRESLDLDYLHSGAEELGVRERLDLALSERRKGEPDG